MECCFMHPLDESILYKTINRVSSVKVANLYT